ncbi:unnamed protein product [Closterium sp. NIES-53]
MATWEARVRSCGERLCQLPDTSFEEIEATSAELRRLLEEGCSEGCASSWKPTTEKGEAGEFGPPAARSAVNGAADAVENDSESEGCSAREQIRERAVWRVLQLLLSLLSGHKASLLIDRASWDILRFLSSPLRSSPSSSPVSSFPPSSPLSLPPDAPSHIPPAPADASPRCCALACQAVGEVASGAGDPREVHAALVEGLSGAIRRAALVGEGAGEGEREGGEAEGEEGEGKEEERWSSSVAPKACQGLHRIASHCIALHCIALHCIALHCIALHWIALHRIALHRIASHRIALHRIASHCIASHCIALHRIALHRIASHCIALHRIASHRIASHRIASHRIASHCIALHRIASHRIASHRIASHRIASHRIASHRIALHI